MYLQTKIEQRASQWCETNSPTYACQPTPTCLHSTPLQQRLYISKIPDQLPLRRRGAASGVAGKKKSLYAENPLYATTTATATTLDTTSVDCPVTPPPSNKVAADKSSTENMNNSSPLSGGAGGAASSTYGMTPEQASKNFDQLRREATKLERHLEDRVARYQQVRTYLYNIVCCLRSLSVVFCLCRCKSWGESKWYVRGRADIFFFMPICK